MDGGRTVVAQVKTLCSFPDSRVARQLNAGVSSTKGFDIANIPFPFGIGNIMTLPVSPVEAGNHPGRSAMEILQSFEISETILVSSHPESPNFLLCV